MIERCDRCGIELAPPDPDDPEDVGTRCGACVKAYGPQLPLERFPAQLEMEVTE
jgi:hypothetical protein